ncbi:MAG: glycerate kinase, partial [Hyphomicrobiales bacterium]
KGATPADVATLEAALTNYARVARDCLGVDISAMPGGGAAGGLAAGLVAFLGARIVSGFDVVAEATNLAERVANAGFVVSGEGSFDSQSHQGKTTGRLLDLAARLDRPAVVFAGRASAQAPNLRTLASLEPDPARAMANASGLLATLAQQWAAAIDP